MPAETPSSSSPKPERPKVDGSDCCIGCWCVVHKECINRGCSCHAPMSAPKPEMLEKIVAAAIKVGHVVHTGPHHATIIHQIVACGGETPVKGEQGFVTSEGRFVGRGEALAVAIHAGQVDFAMRDNIGLMSENLWNVPDPNWEALRASESEVDRMEDARNTAEAALGKAESEVESLSRMLKLAGDTIEAMRVELAAAHAEATQAGRSSCSDCDRDGCPCMCHDAAIRAPRPPCACPAPCKVHSHDPDTCPNCFPSSPTPPTSPPPHSWVSAGVDVEHHEPLWRCSWCQYVTAAPAIANSERPCMRPEPTPPSEEPIT